MTFREDADYSEKYARTGGGGRRLAAGGGIGSLLLVGLFLLLGGNPGNIGEILGDNTQQSSGEAGYLEGCDSAEAANTRADCRVEEAGVSTNKVWEKVLPEQAGLQYTKPGLVVFTNSTMSGCGMASANTGPFYCPADDTAYFDVSFFNQLEKLGGDNAPLAQMYIVAHEFGHHVQKIEGTLGLSNYNQPGADSNAVKIELQADCYAGIWAHHADKGEGAMLETITNDQVRSAVETAAAVGDDNIQKRSGGEVRPDLWTHGSSADRAKAFMTGYQQGTMKSCDTLGRGVYK